MKRPSALRRKNAIGRIENFQSGFHKDFFGHARRAAALFPFGLRMQAEAVKLVLTYTPKALRHPTQERSLLLSGSNQDPPLF
jgi:hypothetical protein